MSLSTLQAQLAAINNAGDKHPGSVQPSSLRHSEAIGRGLAYSVQHGHAVGDTARFKASIRHATARAAADVPLSVVEESARSALQTMSLYADLPSAAILSGAADDKLLQSTLVTIMLLLRVDAHVDDCLHVVEWLLRRYSIHERLGEDLVYCFLASGQGVLFHRCLQLVDLTSSASLLWLRPYATDVPEGLPVPVPPRAKIGQLVVQTLPLLRRWLTTVRHVVAVGEEQAALSNSAQDYLSYATGVLLDGLALLPKGGDQYDREGIMRTLLPTLMSSVASDSEDYRAFGYVLAAETAIILELSPPTMGRLTSRILTTLPDHDLETQADGVMTVLSMLVPPMSVPMDDKDGSYLPLLNGKWLGCRLPSETAEALLAMDSLANVMGKVYADRRRVVAPLVAALLVQSPEWTAVVAQPDLWSMWKDPRLDLIASVAAWFLTRQVHDDSSHDNALLRALFDLGRDHCERGIAEVVLRLETPEDKERAAVLLNDIVAVDPWQVDDTGDARLLPARVALEHADSAVRLDALRRLAEMEEDSTQADEETLTESLLRRWAMDDNAEVALAASTLLCMNNRLEKTLNLTADVGLRLGELTVEGLYRWVDPLVDVTDDKSKALMENCFQVGSHVARQLGRLRDDNIDDAWQQLVEFLVAHMDSDKAGGIAAKAVVIALEESTSKKSKTNMPVLAKACLCKTERLVVGLINVSASDASPVQVLSRRRCTWVVLRALCDASFGEESGSVSHATDALKLCLVLLQEEKQVTVGEAGLRPLAEILGQVLKALTEAEVDMPAVIASLASVASAQAYGAACRSSIKNVASDPSVSSLYVAVLVAAGQFDTPEFATERLLSVAAELSVAKRGDDLLFGLLAGLALLEHVSDRIRDVAVKLVFEVCRGLAQESAWASLATIGACLFERKTSAVLGGRFLPGFLAAWTRTADDGSAKAEILLAACAKVAAWELTSKGESAGCSVAATGLRAAEDAGEEVFPLAMRWRIAGSTVLQRLLDSDVKIAALAESSARMLKGVTVSDPQMVISSGPKSNGGRARAYSVGKLDGVSFIHPYPADMIDAIIKILASDTSGGSRCLLAQLVVQDILTSDSWREGVFSKLPKANRRQVLSAALSYTCSGRAGTTTGLLMGLPIESSDASALLREHEGAIAELAVVTDAIRARKDAILASPGVSDVISTLFKMLSTFCESSDDGSSYMVQSILVALSELWNAPAAETQIKLDKKRVGSFADVLQVLLTGSIDGTALESLRSRHAALSCLRGMCRKYHAQVRSALLTILEASISHWKGRIMSSDTQETIATVVPLLHRFSSDDNSLAKVYGAFVKSTDDFSESQRLSLYTCLSRSVLGSTDNRLADHGSVASLLCLSLAMKSVDDADSTLTEEIRLVVNVLDALDATDQLHVLVIFLQHFILLLRALGGDATVLSDPSIIELVALATRGQTARDDTNDREACVLRLSAAIARCFGDALLLEKLQACVSTGTGDAASLSLGIWQELMIADATTSGYAGAEKLGEQGRDMYRTMLSVLAEAKGTLQNVLPIHVFLASVSSLVHDGGSDNIRANALRLVADRVVEIDPRAAEAGLFVELVPDILKLVSSSSNDVVLLSALLALEHMARTLSKPKTDYGERNAVHFVPVLKACDELLSKKCLAMADDSKPETSLIQEVCSLALCCATLVRSVGTRSLSTMPSLLKSHVTILEAANSVFQDKTQGDNKEYARAVQLSVIRGLTAMVEAVPQFLPAYLKLLLTEDTLLSPVIRSLPSAYEGPLEPAVLKLDKALSASVAPRIFIPAASKAAALCSNPVALQALLSVMRDSLDKASITETAAQHSNILSVVTSACEYDGPFTARWPLVQASIGVLLVMVMKLSEVQLRRTYVSLREWCGELEDGTMTSRRFAFWSLSSALAAELRSIFLPCLSAVANDAIAELEIASKQLTDKKKTAKSAEGKKRRRLDSDASMEAALKDDSLRSLEPLLECLTHSLRADARDGGEWVRSEENQRFSALLEPLGRLLQCQLPQNFPIAPGANAFQYLVQGADDQPGSVVNCITALASAAGNEQLWKPLNHVVLEACGHESRSEVRKAGLLCLLSLIRSLGEEYMVLLPECLPVLSEILEESDEDNVRLAREIIALAEELIGESLEDSFR